MKGSEKMEKLMLLAFDMLLGTSYILLAFISFMAIQGLVYRLSHKRVNIYKAINKFLWKEVRQDVR